MSQNPDELADSDQERLVRMPRNPELAADMGNSDHEALQEDRQLEEEAEQGPSGGVALPFGFQQNPQPSTSRQTGMAADGGRPRSGHKLNFFLFPLCEKSLICLEGKSMTPPVGKILFSCVPPSNSLVSVSDPRGAF